MALIDGRPVTGDAEDPEADTEVGLEVPDDCTLADSCADPLFADPVCANHGQGDPAGSPKTQRALGLQEEELLARVCGLMDPDATFDDKSHDACVSLFKTPLSAPVIHAIETLVKQAAALRYYVVMSIHNVNLLCWNVRGLNNPARRSAVCDIIRDTHATVVCIQETKLQLVDGRLIRDILGPKFCNNFATLPSAGTRGGMIMAVSDDYFMLSDIHLTTHSITATVTMRSEGIPWSLTSVYGPQSDAEKLLFIDELRLLQPVVKAEWVLMGDFNLITKATDKNNTNINRRLIGKFRGALNFLQLKEISLGRRRFT
ncbi:hypothetical protein BRADI_4g14215v3 [Brachypodium distachyon]|uniref:Endonuclease/exonuclease/phosphatase domain-containing protein n=1 Tax=Brachypodium distachyon TaxID=15368 RepID=A0A2K2CMR6_BRADI|nr:hypothetical protein BRADI_4g14215v3 [Brachypodium distachyon]